MRLVSTVLGFLLKKLSAFVAVVVTVFVGYLLIHTLVPPLREAIADRDRIERVAQEREDLEQDLSRLKSAAAEEQSEVVESLEGRLATEVADGRRKISDKKGEIDRLRDDRDDLCGVVRKVISWVLPGNACETAEEALAKADEALGTLESSLARAEQDAAVLDDPALTDEQKLAHLDATGEGSLVEREIANTESELAQKRAEEKSLEQAQNSKAAQVIRLWERSWRWAAGIAVLVIVGPAASRVVGYFVLMPLVARAHRRIRLSDGSDLGPADIQTSAAQRTLTVDLSDGDVLSARSEHVRPVEGKVRGRILYDWSSPFISFAAGLSSLSRVTGGEGGTPVTLATPDGPDSYLMRIDFRDHPGLVMQARHVVGIIGTPKLMTRWRWGIQSFATWQVRYILFTGTGSLIVEGTGDVSATTPREGSTRMEQHLVMGFDSRLAVGVQRTEVFWSYLRRRTPLVDDEFSGPHPFFWQKSSSAGPSNPIAKAFDVFFSAFGKLFGF